MPGGGGIGGRGSCELDFTVRDNQGQTIGVWKETDKDAKGDGGNVKVVVTFTFPNGDVREEKLKKDEKVLIEWR
jgi:hypothetical protein